MSTRSDAVTKLRRCPFPHLNQSWICPRVRRWLLGGNSSFARPPDFLQMQGVTNRASMDAFGRFTKLMRSANPVTSRSVQRASTKHCVVSTVDAEWCLDCLLADDEGLTRRQLEQGAWDAALLRSIISKFKTKSRASPTEMPPPNSKIATTSWNGFEWRRQWDQWQCHSAQASTQYN